MEIFGWGKKNTADVNEQGELLTYAESFSTDYDAAQGGDAYTLDIDGITTGAVNLYLVVMKNSHSTKEMIVTRFHLAPNTADDDQDIEVLIGGSFSYLAEGTAVTPTNLHSDKAGGAADGVANSFYVADGTADIITTVVAGSVASRFPMPLKKEYDCTKRSGWHILPGNCFILRPSKDEKFRGFISFYYRG